MTAGRALAMTMIAAFAAGCESPMPAPSRPAPVVDVPLRPANAASSASVPAGASHGNPPADEAFGGLRFGATRAEIQAAFPKATCTPDGCTGETQLYGWPAQFSVFAQPDGRWVARVWIVDAAGVDRNFSLVGIELRNRFRQAPENTQAGNQLRWKLDKDAKRQVILRRCPADQQCRGLPRSNVEVDWFDQGAPNPAW